MIPKDELEQGAWYYGDGRLGPVAQWNGLHFQSIGYSWGQHQIDTMEYGDKGYTPMAVIDKTFTPEVLKAVNDALDTSMGLVAVPLAPRITSLQDLSVIQQFLLKFMEVGTYQLNVETQIEHLKLAMMNIAKSRVTDADELRTIARESLGAISLLRRK
jgi:hypothetical protein